MPQPYRLLLVVSEPVLSNNLATFLEEEGYRVTCSSDGVAGLNLVHQTQPDVIILDVDLPGIDGITLCGTIRKQVDRPIILFTSPNHDLQQVIGFDRGADLCMVKPIATGELRARIRALLRRSDQVLTPYTKSIEAGELRLDVRMRRAWSGDKELQLTPKEFDLLAYLMANRGLVLPRGHLLRDVWGGQVASTSQTLDVHIRWLRQKVEPDPERPVYIHTVRMIGYRFEEPAGIR
jgi:DNA-binding response OmpR family regulator